MKKINLKPQNSICTSNRLTSNQSTSNKSITFFSAGLFMCLSFLFTSSVFAQSTESTKTQSTKQQKPQKLHKSKERMDMIKKMKLLEILELDEANADKFLIRYSSSEKKIEENFQAIQNARKELEQALAEKSKSVAEKTNKLVTLKEERSKLQTAKLKDMKSVLSETEYAKYVLFEHSFFHDVCGAFMHGSRAKSSMEKGAEFFKNREKFLKNRKDGKPKQQNQKSDKE